MFEKVQTHHFSDIKAPEIGNELSEQYRKMVVQCLNFITDRHLTNVEKAQILAQLLVGKEKEANDTFSINDIDAIKQYGFGTDIL